MKKASKATENRGLLLDYERQDLELRRERIRLIYQEAMAEKMLAAARSSDFSGVVDQPMLCLRSPVASTNSTVSSAYDPPATTAGEADEIVPATDDEDNGGAVGASIAPSVAAVADVPSQSDYDALLQTVSSEEERQRILSGKQLAACLQLNADDRVVVQEAKCSFLSTAKLPTKLAHLDAFCMPGFRTQLFKTRMPDYESHLEGRLQRCMERAYSRAHEGEAVAMRGKSWHAASNKQETARVTGRINHYCLLVHLSLMRQFLRSDVDECLVDRVAGGGDFHCGRKTGRVDWFDLDRVSFQLQCADVLEASGIVPKREAVLSIDENTACAQAEAKLLSERQRWTLLTEEEVAAAAAGSSEAASSATEMVGKIVYAKKKLRDSRWATKVYVAQTLCQITKLLLLNDGGIVQDLFVQKFSRAEGSSRKRSRMLA